MQVAQPIVNLLPPYSPLLAMQQQRHSQSQSQSQSVQPQPTATRKRKRVPPPLVHYRSEHHVDQTGRVREVIVIEDTPPPSGTTQTPSTAPPVHPSTYSAPNSSQSYQNGVRTRAQAAAAATGSSYNAEGSHGTGSGSAASSSVVNAPAPKRRRKDGYGEDVVTNGINAISGPSSNAYARKAIASRPIDHQNLYPQQQPGALTWASQGSGGSGGVGTESVRASQVSQASAQVQTPVYDDKEGYYIINPNDVLGSPPRYRIIKLLGQGTFGKVVEAYDTYTRTRVAVKIIRAIQKYRDASKIEIRVLKTLKNHDPNNVNKCIHLLEWFDHRNHICIVTELLGLCIYDFLRDNDFQPFPRRHIQDFARQLLKSVAFLHDLNLIHTDLKPENILLVDSNYRTVNIGRTGKQKRILHNTDVRLIDFGSATFDDEYHPTVVSTRHYRAPEIILGLGWSFPCDAFSVGCILVEFYTGIALYQTHDNLEHLAMMEAVMGKMPVNLARKAARTKPEFFKRTTDPPVLDWPRPKVSKQSRREVKATKPLSDVIKSIDVCNGRFLDLVRRLLAWETSERITVKEALSHPFFDLHIPPEP